MTTEELHNLIELAEQGDTETQFALGEYYYLSTDNTESDEDYENACKEQ